MRLRASGNSKRSHQGRATSRIGNNIGALNVYWVQGLLGVAIVILLAFAAGAFAWIENERADRLRELQGNAAMIARQIEKRVAEIQGSLLDATTDPWLQKVFLDQSIDEVRTAEARLARRVPGAQRVRLVSPTVCRGKELQTERLSYAGLDLVCRAGRQRNVTRLEVHRTGSPEEHLALAAPVLDAEGQSLLGVVHVALPISLLPSLEDAGGGWGHLGFQQWVANEPVTLTMGDGAATLPKLPDSQLPIEGTSLRVAVWVGAQVPDTVLLWRIATAYLMSLTLVALATWLPLRGLRRSLMSDYKGVVSLVEDAVSGRKMRTFRCGLVETQPLVDALTGLLHPLPPVGASAHSVPEAERPGLGEQTVTAGKPAAKSRAESTQITPSDAAYEPLSRIESVPAWIFRAYDIRGVVDRDLTTDLMYAIGLAVGTEVAELGDHSVAVGRDSRPSGKGLAKSLVAGLRNSGRDVLDLGVVPTPIVYFAAHYEGGVSGAMVTASHNPESYNGLKVVIGGETLTGERIQRLRQRILNKSFAKGDGDYRQGDLVSDYLGRVEKDVAIARTLRVVVDCGNATAAMVAPQLYWDLGCDPIELNCDLDIGFPAGRVPDPTCPEHLADLQQTVISQGADLGLAFDGDGNRLGVVDSSGKIIWPDRVLMLLAADVLSRQPGTDIIFDVECSNHLASEILRHGGRPLRWKSEHAPVEAKMRETGALLAGAWSGRIFFRERWYGFGDALYAGARLLEVLALDPRPSAEVFAELPEALGTSELLLHLAEGEATQVMQAVLEQAAQVAGVDVSTEEGLRMESEQGWGMVRASNTQPALIFRFEAEDDVSLSEIQDLFRRIMQRVAPKLELPF
jgi:phosphomannomutase/phosphoglucomutase